MNGLCLLGRHDVGTWTLRPRLIGTRVEWLRWERGCSRQTFGRRPWRCRYVERRWFRVHVPHRWRPGRRPIDVEAYLAQLGTRAPPPETLSPSKAPPLEAMTSLTR